MAPLPQPTDFPPFYYSYGPQPSDPQEPDPELSVVEELEPEPEPAYARAGTSRRRELVLGLLLLAAVLGWAGWQWWYQDTAQNSYNLALQAEAKKQWDQAYSRYTAAAGYRDAAGRASAIATTIAERDRHLANANTYSQRGEWFNAYRELAEVERIQPGYTQQGEHAGVRSQVEDQAWKLALSGIDGAIVAVSSGDPWPDAGLYYLDMASGGWMGGWTWLAGSDHLSRVQSRSAGGPVIYDIPAAPAPGRDPAVPATSTSASATPEGQRTFMAMWRGEGSGYTFSVACSDGPADVNGQAWPVAGAGVVWCVQNPASPVPDNEVWSQLDTHYTRLAYRPAGSDALSQVNLPGPGWAVVDPSGRGGRILLAELSASAQVTATGRTIRVYTANPDGSDRHLIYNFDSFNGLLRSAHLSPDGRYALLTTYEQGGDRGGVQAVLLVDTYSGSTIVLSRRTVLGWWSGHPPQFVGAAFIEAGPFAGRVILGEWGWNSRLTILDPAAPRDNRITINLRDDMIAANRPMVLVWDGGMTGTGSEENTQPGAEGLMVWVPGSDTGGARAGALTVVKVFAGDPQAEDRADSALCTPLCSPPHICYALHDYPRYQIYTIPIESGPRVSSAVVRSSYLVYEVAKNYGRDGYEVYTVPVDQLGYSQPKLLLAYTGQWPPTAEYHPQAAIAGSIALVYIEHGELHARTYDGTVDISLAKGVQGLYGPPAQDSVVLR